MTNPSLVFIGLGLYDEKDITIKGLEEIKKSEKIFAEFYTARLMGSSINKLEELFGKKIQVLTRQQTEEGKQIIESALKQKTAFLTAGDPMTATTHVDLRIRAVQKGIKTKVIHGNSIISAVPGLLGLQNYKFGRATTMVYPEKNYFPTSPYEIIKKNKENGFHTLLLLDIKDDEKRYMTANEAMKLLLGYEEKLRSGLFSDESIICVIARAGSEKPVVKSGMIMDLIDLDYGEPLHTMVIPGRLHFMEIEALMVLAQLPAQQGEKLQKN